MSDVTGTVKFVSKVLSTSGVVLELTVLLESEIKLLGISTVGVTGTVVGVKVASNGGVMLLANTGATGVIKNIKVKNNIKDFRNNLAILFKIFIFIPFYIFL